MSLNESRAEAAMMHIRVGIERAANGIRVDLGMSPDRARIRQLEQLQLQRSPRFAATIRFSGVECNSAGNWLPVVHIEHVPAYASLDYAKHRAEDVFNAFQRQTATEHDELIRSGEFPFRPSSATVLDQFGFAIARMEVQEADGALLPFWVGEVVFDGHSQTARALLSQASELQSRADQLRSAGAAASVLSQIRREAQRICERAQIIEFSQLVAA